MYWTLAHRPKTWSHGVGDIRWKSHIDNIEHFYIHLDYISTRSTAIPATGKQFYIPAQQSLVTSFLFYSSCSAVRHVRCSVGLTRQSLIEHACYMISVSSLSSACCIASKDASVLEWSITYHCVVGFPMVLKELIIDLSVLSSK